MTWETATGTQVQPLLDTALQWPPEATSAHVKKLKRIGPTSRVPLGIMEDSSFAPLGLC